MGFAFIIVVAIMAISITAILSESRKAVLIAQMKMRSNDDPQLKASLDALHAEIRALRDTSMQYDLSFDTALQKIDQRVGFLERRLNQIEESQPQHLTIKS